ncbi:STAS domain-containing protein [Streptomyces sp. NPDC005574]|uniref:STAS domain-containing protein n=1 Tax=Streptomyces sp. NPDC005574 TaxID=3156891 RepID=UPI0033B1546B
MAENHLRSTPNHTQRTGDGATLVTLRGDMDLLAAPALAIRLDELTAGAHPDLVLDLRSVSFIDCAGLGLLCRARNRARARQGRLRLVADSDRFLRMLCCTGLADVFDVLPGRPEDAPAAPVAQPGSAAG